MRIRLLCFSDLHASKAAARKLAMLARDVDLLVGAGDFGDFRQDVDACIPILKKTGKPAILVPGNNESRDELTAACRGWTDATVLHGGAAERLGLSFFGLGGGVPVTPFGDWSWDLTEAAAAALLETMPAAAVLVSHSPPHGVVDLDSSGRNLGSRSVRAATLHHAPHLVVCGHIHASAGQVGRLGPTPVLNAGPVGTVWELDAP